MSHTDVYILTRSYLKYWFVGEICVNSTTATPALVTSLLASLLVIYAGCWLVSETGGQVGVTRSPQSCLCTTSVWTVSN